MWRRHLFVLIAAVLLVLAPTGATADELDLRLVEDDTGVTLQIRGFDSPTVQAKKVITSRKGALLFLEGHRAKTQRLRPQKRHRLGFVQIGRNGRRVAVRLAQRDRARGLLNRYLTQTVVDGGIDIRVEDKAPSPPTNASDDDEEIEVEIDEEDTDEEPSPNAATIATLEASLGSPVPKPLAPVAAPAAEVEPPTEPAPVESASEEPPPAPPQSESTGESSAVTGVTLTVLLLLTGVVAVWYARRRRGLAPTQALNVISRVGVGPRQQILLIQAGDRQLLVGATERRIALLSELGASAIPTAPAQAPAAQTRVAAFKARLQQALSNHGAPESPEGAADAYEDETPVHLRLLSRDPAWTRGEDAA